MYLDNFRELEKTGSPIRVGIVGLGAMGKGMAFNMVNTPGIKLVAIGDINQDKIDETKALIPDSPCEVRDCAAIAAANDIDIFMEASSSIKMGLEYTKAAIEARNHVILMNGEVDCFYGPELYEMATSAGVTFSSTDGDQYGVLIKLMQEVELMDLKPIMIGNIKGFLDRHATPESIAYEAEIRNLDPQMCVTYTDGTKLAIEMAIMSNATGFVPYKDHMEGPRMKNVHEVLDYYDFDEISKNPCVEYILGAEPGGGVFIVAECHHKYQQDLLQYYKMGDGPHYVFYRPYHLCHLETAYAVGRVWFDGVPLLAPWKGRVANIYALAKRNLKPGDILGELGQDTVYGEMALQTLIGEKGWLLAHEAEGKRVKADIAQDAPIKLDDVE